MYAAAVTVATICKSRCGGRQGCGIAFGVRLAAGFALGHAHRPGGVGAARSTFAIPEWVPAHSGDASSIRAAVSGIGPVPTAAHRAHTQGRERAQGIHSGDYEERAASGVADEHAERNRNQRREDDCDHRVLKVLEDTGADPSGTAPVGGSEDEGQRLLQEVHAAAPAFGLAVRADAPVALVHGVSALPANMISVSMTIASTKMAMMPAMIWSLLLAW
jgi:hypothetical protein